jgi:hypothetical protein
MKYRNVRETVVCKLLMAQSDLLERVTMTQPLSQGSAVTGFRRDSRLEIHMISSRLTGPT